MPLILCPCKSLSVSFFQCTLKKTPHTKLPPQKFCAFTNKFAILGTTHVAFCSRNAEIDGLLRNEELSQEAVDERIPEQETLELLNKPSFVPIRNGSSSSEVEVDTGQEREEAVAPFSKCSKGRDLVEVKEDGGVLEVLEQRDEMGGDKNEEEAKKVTNGEYYEPKPGDFVVGVVVSGNENRLNVNVGAELPGTMLTKEVLPLNGKQMEYLICDGNNKCEENFMAQGRMGILKYDDAMPVGNTVVEIGTILFAEVLGRTLTGRPLLSTRRFFRRIAWHRLRQIKQLNEPITVRVTEWNTSGLLTRIEGMRAFLPKAELLKRVNSFTDLKESIGRCMHVQITEVDEAKNNVIVSEREAWEKLYLREGTLLQGTVKKILPYGAQIRIGETNRSGLLHVSNITRGGITSVSDILSVDEKVKVLVVKSAFPDKISLSIADLESEPGLFLSHRERVFLEADMMAKKYKENLPPALITQQSESLSNSALPFENEALYANWNWFKFEK